MDVDGQPAPNVLDKGKAPMANGTATNSKGYELPWVSPQLQQSVMQEQETPYASHQDKDWATGIIKVPVVHRLEGCRTSTLRIVQDNGRDQT